MMMSELVPQVKTILDSLKKNYDSLANDAYELTMALAKNPTDPSQAEARDLLIATITKLEDIGKTLPKLEAAMGLSTMTESDVPPTVTQGTPKVDSQISSKYDNIVSKVKQQAQKFNA